MAATRTPRPRKSKLPSGTIAVATPRIDDTKASIVAPLIIPVAPNTPIWTRRDYGRLSEEAYIRNVIGHRCIRLVARNVARLPWIVTRGKVEIETHPLKELMRRPNPIRGGARFWQDVISFYKLSGNAYIEAVRPGLAPDQIASKGFPPNELWTWRTDRVQVVASINGVPGGFRYQSYRGEKTIPVDNVTGHGSVLHLKDFHPVDDWYGLASTEAAAYAIDQHNSASAHNRSLLGNGAAPAGAFVFKERLAPDQIRDAEANLRNRIMGTKHSGTPLVLGGDWSFETWAQSNRDMEFVEMMRQQARNICQAFDVPHVLVVEGESTYANREQAYLELFEIAVIPEAEMLRDDLNNWLKPMYGDDVELAIDYDQIPALTPRRIQHATMVRDDWTADLITLNEAREARQWEPLEDGDKTKSQRGQEMALQIAQATKPQRVSVVPEDDGEPGQRPPQRQGPPPANDDRGVPPPRSDALARRSMPTPEIKSLYGMPGTFAAAMVAEKSARALVAWASAMNIPDIVPAEQMHATIIASRVPLPAYEPDEWLRETVNPKEMTVGFLGPDDARALVIFFESWWLQWKHEQALRQGGSWDFPGDYRPHIAVSYTPGELWPKTIAPPPFGILLAGEIVRDFTGEAPPSDKGKSFREVKAAGDQSSFDFGPEFDKIMADLTRPIVEATVRNAGQRLYDELRFEAVFDILDPNVIAFMEEFGAQRIVGISDTTKQAVRKTLVQGREAGEGTFDLMKRIRLEMENATRARAKVIAETEITNASGFARQEAMTNAGVDFKQWLATPDSHTRDTHRRMGGQIKRVGEPFVSPSGAKGQGPGQFSSKAENIYCRCAAVPIPQELLEQAREDARADQAELRATKPARGRRGKSAEIKRSDRLRQLWEIEERARRPFVAQMEEAVTRAFAFQTQIVINQLSQTNTERAQNG